MKSGTGGFTIIEVMMVVCIVAMLMVIALPNLVRGRHDAAEAAARETLNQLTAAMVQYKAAEMPHVYPGDLTALGPKSGGALGYVNAVLATGNYQGYRFLLAANADAFTIRAFPERPGITGTRIFAVTETGQISEVGP